MTRAAIRTTYNGVRFRSRLEAKWACVFDRLGWRWEYEPFDLDGYIPDFILLGADPVLVEVKPAVSTGKLDDAKPKIERSGWNHDALIVGGSLRPYISESYGAYLAHWYPLIGLLGQYGDEATSDGHEWGYGLAHTCRECGRPSFHHDHQTWRSRVCGH